MNAGTLQWSIILFCVVGAVFVFGYAWFELYGAVNEQEELYSVEKEFCPEVIGKNTGFGLNAYRTYCPQSDETLKEFICTKKECYYLEEA